MSDRFAHDDERAKTMLTILTPTFNRSDFLLRLLEYYKIMRCRYQILIGDSSIEPHAQTIKNAVERYQPFLNIMYKFYPGLNEPQATAQMLDEVTTPYVTWIPDDDFLVMPSLGRSVSFLEQHADYTVAHGQAALFSLEQSGPYGRILADRKSTRLNSSH